MRRVLLLTAVFALLTAGCLSASDGDLETAGDDQNTTQTPNTGDANETSPDRQASDNEAAANETREDEARGNGTAETASEDDGNETETASEPDPGWPPLEEARVRPGVGLGSSAMPLGPQTCTSNFVFASPDNATLYLGTAAHCVDDLQPGDTIPITGTDFEGRLWYSGWWDEENETHERGHGQDFALLALPASARPVTHPAVMEIGGPTGVAAVGDVDVMDELLWYGNSSYRADVDPLQDNRAYVCDPGDGVSPVLAHPLPSGVPRDSGSPVLLADGAALGPLVGGSVPACPTMGGLAYRIPPLPAALAQASDRGYPVELATWPLLDG